MTVALLCAVGSWADTDYTSSMSNSTSEWTGVGSKTSIGVCKTDGVETYQGNTTQFDTGDVLYQTISGIPNGIYLISFYAWENYANWEEASISVGNDIAQVFANTTAKGIEVIKNTGGRDWNDANTYALVTKVTDGTLKYGVKNIAAGGNWAACKPISLTYKGSDGTVIDFTDILINPTISNTDKEQMPNGWSEYKRENAGNNNRTEGTGNTQLEGYAPTNQDGFSIDYYQPVSALPEGWYSTTAKVHDRDNGGATLYIFSNSTGSNVKKSVTMTTDYSVMTTPMIYVTDNGSITIGIEIDNKKGTWFTGDDFKLTYYGSTLSYPLDLTARITNPDFSNDPWNAGWSGTGTDKDKAFIGNTNGSFTGTMAEMWVPSGTNMSAADLNQTINELPAGVYTLSAKIQAGITCKLYADVEGQSEQYLEYNGAVANKSFRFIVNSANDVQIGLKHDGITSPGESVWVAVDDLQLVYEGDLPSASDKTAFTTALATANAKTLGFDDGEYAPYANIDAINSLSNANSIDVDIATKGELTTATTELTTLWVVNNGEVNAIYNPTFALSTNDMTAIGWGSDDGSVIGNESGDYHSRALVGNVNLASLNGTSSALYLRYDGTNSSVSTIYNYGTLAGYTMPLKAGTIYRFKADAAVWSTDETQRYKDLRVAILNTNSTEVGGQTLTTPNSSMGSGSTDKISYDFIFCPAANGNYTLTVDNMAETSTGIVISNFELKRATININEEANSTQSLAGTANVTLTRNFNASAWNSLVLPFDMTLAEAQTVFGNDITIANYTGTNEVSPGVYQLQFSTENPSITANEPVLIWGATSVDGSTISGREIKTETPSLTPNDATYSFVGSYDASTQLASGDYFIGSDNKLYSVGYDLPSMKGTRAFFRPVSAGVKAMSFEIDGDETGIVLVDSEGTQVINGEIYNLAGQRVNKAQKGIYIVNGNKILVK